MANDQLAALVAALSDPAQRSRLPAGMRNNNPGNIKFVGQAGTHPSQNTDQGDPQAVYDTPEAGMRAMYGLLGRKYAGGKHSANAMIAGQGGWTPGNYQAAANVARNAGFSPDQDINFNDPHNAARFMRGLMLQEHGPSSKLYPDDLITASIGGTPFAMPSIQPSAGPFAGLPDGPKGQEVYAPPTPFGTMAPGGGGMSPAPDRSIPTGVAQFWNAMPGDGQNKDTMGNRLQKAGQIFSQATDFKAPRPGPFPGGPSAEQAGGLLKATNNITQLAQMLLQKRMG